jgi:hypothetical protein
VIVECSSFIEKLICQWFSRAIWMYDKLSVKLQVPDIISMPLVLAIVLPMILEVVFAGMCQRWQTVNRRQRPRGRCLRWCCCRRQLHSDDWNQPRRCCTRILNCFMCDEDAGTDKEVDPPVLLCSDEDLAKEITRAIGDPATIVTVHTNGNHTSKLCCSHSKTQYQSMMST